MYRYRQFRALSSRNLLYMQSEIANLESRLSELDASLEDGDLSSWEISRSWDKMNSESEEAKTHLALVLDIRDKIEKYRKAFPKPFLQAWWLISTDTALQLQASILTLKEPDRRLWKILQTVVTNDEDVHMLDKDMLFLKDGNRRDLVALAVDDTEPLANLLLRAFHRVFQSKVRTISYIWREMSKDSRINA